MFPPGFHHLYGTRMSLIVNTLRESDKTTQNVSTGFPPTVHPHEYTSPSRFSRFRGSSENCLLRYRQACLLLLPNTTRCYIPHVLVTQSTYQLAD